MISVSNVIEYIRLLRCEERSVREWGTLIFTLCKEQCDTIVSQVTITIRIKHY